MLFRSELRLAFNSGIDLNKRIEDYKMNQYYGLLSNKSNLLKTNSPIFVVHYIPISAFNNSLQLFSISDIKKSVKESNSTAFGDTTWKTITIDGISINYNQYNNKSIANFKNNGIIEKATNDWFEKDFVIQGIIPKVTVDHIYSEDLLNRYMSRFY